MIAKSEQYRAAVTADRRQVDILAVVDISDPDTVWGETESSALAPWSKPQELRDKNMDPPRRYATLEPGRWLLDGTFSIFPDSFQVPQHMGVASAALSGPDGVFSEPQWVQMNFSKVDVLQAFSLIFSSDPVDGVPADFTVEVRTGEQVFFSKSFVDNRETSVSLDGFTVHIPTSIKVTVTRWSLPGRRMRMVEILPGLYERWSSDMQASFSVVHQGDFSALSVPYGSMDLAMDNLDRRFEPRRKNGVFQSIEDRQGVEVFIGIRLLDGSYERAKLGVFYQAGDGWKTSENAPTMNWHMVDIIGLLASRTFLPPASLPTTLAGWLQALVSQLGTNFSSRWSCDGDYAGKAVTAKDRAAVTGKKCGDILKWACQATGTWARADAETGYLCAEPLWKQGNKVTLDNLTAYPTMKANESLAALIFQLSDGTERVISGNATASEKTVTIKNPFIHTADQALTAARLILSCYGGNLYELTGRGDPASEIGDVDTIWLDESNATTARRMMQTFEIRNGVLQGCRSRLLQADGSYLYEAFAVIRQDGPWQAPEGVTRLRVVIGSGGQGGGRGQDGQWESAGSSNISFSGYRGVEGKPGVDGQGGRIWYGVIDINPGQIFEVKLGAGGAPGGVYGSAGALGTDTTFGPYSSANGKYYETGYTDIANGQVFARTGVPAPLPGTADGGKGGKGGTAGAGYLDWVEHDFAPDGGQPGETITGHYEWVTTEEPGPGQPGIAGASGFVMVTWDKPA